MKIVTRFKIQQSPNRSSHSGGDHENLLGDGRRMQTWSGGDQAPTWYNGSSGDGSVQRHLRQPVHVPADQAQDDVESDVVEPIGQVLAG